MDGYTVQRLGSHTQNGTLSSAVTLTPPSGADILQIQPLTQNVRIVFDGSTPDATTGFQLTAGTIYFIDVGQDYSIKLIEETASASVEYQWGQRKRDNDA